MTKRKPDESETDYLRRKLRKLEKKMKKLPSESASLPPPPPPPQAESPVPLSPPSPPVIREPTPRRMPVNAEESSKNNAEELIIGMKFYFLKHYVQSTLNNWVQIILYYVT
jgi:hypothetical protein